MKRRVAVAVALMAVYAGAMRVTGQTPGGAQGSRSAARDWAAEKARSPERF